jgi:hypothetical protein
VGFETLRWFSILNLDPKSIRAQLKKAGKTVPDAFKTLPANGDGDAGKDSALSIFAQWMMDHGCMRISDQAGDWFSSQGWFDIDKFYSFLQTKTITVNQLKDAGERQAWGEHLKQVLFKENVRGDLRLFDNSPQAQFVRCLTPSQDNLHTDMTGDGPSFSLTDGVKTSGKASLTYDLAYGEVELLKVDLPDRAKATDLTVKYYIENDDTPQSMNLGRFSMFLGARAWGYAGASLALAGDIDISRGTVKYGVNLSPIKQAQRNDAEAVKEQKAYAAQQQQKQAAGDNSPSAPLEYQSKAATAVVNSSSDTKLTGKAANVQVDQGIKATFNLFASAQVGIVLTGAMNWAPPKDLATLLTAPTNGVDSSSEPGRRASG